MTGAALAAATGAHKRFGLAIVLTAAADASFPDWDDLPGITSLTTTSVHRIWGHSILTAPLGSVCVALLGYLCHRSLRREPPVPALAVPAAASSASARPVLLIWVLLGLLASFSHI